MTKTKSANDPEMAEFEAALLRSVGHAKSGKAAPKVPTTIRLSPEVSATFRATGDGWQTRIDAALKDWLRTHSPV